MSSQHHHVPTHDELILLSQSPLDPLIISDMMLNGGDIIRISLAVMNVMEFTQKAHICDHIKDHTIYTVSTTYQRKINPSPRGYQMTPYNRFLGHPLDYGWPRVIEYKGDEIHFCGAIINLYHTCNAKDRSSRGFNCVTGIGYFPNKILIYSPTINLRTEIDLDGNIRHRKPLWMTRNHIIKRILLRDRCRDVVMDYGPEDLKRRYFQRWKFFVMMMKKRRCHEELLYSPDLPKWFKNESHKAMTHFEDLAEKNS